MGQQSINMEKLVQSWTQLMV